MEKDTAPCWVFALLERDRKRNTKPEARDGKAKCQADPNPAVGCWFAIKVNEASHVGTQPLPR
jgi:hypothetical protein